MAHAASRRRGLPGNKSRPPASSCESFTNSAAVSSASPPISPIMITASVSGSRLKRSSASKKVGSDNRIAADADGSRLPNAALRELMHCFVSQRARARDNADRSFFMNRSRHNSDFAFPGRDDSGTIGPISRERRFCRNSQAFTMSSVGMPSVMQTMRSSSASAASMIASAANGGGTKITVASAPVFSTAS